MMTLFVDENDDTYEIALKDQRVFGAGLKRKRVHFVPSGSTAATSDSTSASESTSHVSAGDRYLAIVTSKSPFRSPAPSPVPETQQDTSILLSPQGITHATSSDKALEAPAICEICGLPITTPLSQPNEAPSESRPHAASLAHQVALPHSHPPSHLPRTSKGLSYLKAYGWDPDARLGLGAQGSEGRLYPIAAKEKRDTLGVGLTATKKVRDENHTKAVDVLGLRKLEGRGGSGNGSDVASGKNVQKLDAGKVRQKEELEKRKGIRLQQMFYGSEDLEKYLGS